MTYSNKIHKHFAPGIKNVLNFKSYSIFSYIVNFIHYDSFTIFSLKNILTVHSINTQVEKT